MKIGTKIFVPTKIFDFWHIHDYIVIGIKQDPRLDHYWNLTASHFGQEYKVDYNHKKGTFNKKDAFLNDGDCGRVCIELNMQNYNSQKEDLEKFLKKIQDFEHGVEGL